MPLVCLEYAHPPNEGTGARLHAIAAIFGLASWLRIGYRHTVIREISWDQTEVMKTERDRTQEIERINSFFILPDLSTGRVSSSEIYVDLPRLSFRALPRLAVQLVTRLGPGKTVTFRISNPHPLLRFFPGVYRHASAIWSERFGKLERRGPSGKKTLNLRVVSHFRRETLTRLTQSGASNPRFLASSWYSSVMNSLIHVSNQNGAENELKIHTDFKKGLSRRVPKNLHPGTREYMESVGALSPGGKTYVEPEDTVFLEVSERNGAEILTGLRPLDVILDFADADIFVGGKSSLSFVGGLLRYGKPVVFPKFWVSTPSWWLELPTEKIGNVQIERKIKRYLRSFPIF